MVLGGCRSGCGMYYPCPLPTAITITVTSTAGAGPVPGAFVQASGTSGSYPCTSSATATTCTVLGSAGTYELDIGAPSYTTVHRLADVHAIPAACGCATLETVHLDVALTPS